ncbi:TRAP transporter small permease [Muricauda oceani]|uniref:TRAP transporter small permease n=1 Tax=Flagellimonas oceani TaxID=2698672 RepID=A0A6G7J4F3_9FLAO|nr:TRAP transporter small permease [Allomuricauda oceani]MBW8243551.1 TRAP transporter small permease [Allomuricauda oceani]QII45761.1 TRAP transporter small permease [Allomuricauda oceani]
MKRHIDTFLEWVLAILLGAMVLDVVWGVFTRYLLESQSSWTDELARFLLVWLSILGAAYASGKKLHIAIDLWPQNLDPKKEKYLNLIVISVVLLFAVSIFLIGGLRYVYISFALGQTSPALQLPIGFVNMVLPISGFFILYYKLSELFDLLKNMKNGN